jgi:hypothetical protein
MFSKPQHYPILILLTLSLFVGAFTFQDYGMTWDEGLYYGYGEAIGYAYSIPERLSGDFDINFITFLIGIFYFYKLSLRWLKPESAFGASLLYLSQPLLWGHAFINPKDPPFTTIFIATLYYGFKMVDQLSIAEANEKEGVSWREILLVGILVGLATNLRIIAPMLGILLILYAFSKREAKVLLYFIPVALVSILVTYLTWPYLWDAPIARFTEVLTLMSNNPTKLKVLFYGNTYRAYELPLRYLPTLLGITLTEPTWLLFLIGSGVAIFRIIKKKVEWQSLGILLFYFIFMLGYVLGLRPPMYDGFRHFLFILPPIFVIAGIASLRIYLLQLHSRRH